ncbi:MAG: acetylserotonin O-methyltransferase [Nitrospira sp.]|nr:acetylserotonin O-methyltransferase [Nitrospira sp.]
MTYRDLLRLANGYADSKVLLLANELDLFTAIGRSERRAELLAKRCGTLVEGMTLLLQALAGLGLLRQRGSYYRNTPLGLKFLDGHSPTALTNLLWLLNHHWSDWTDMVTSIRRGRRGWAPVTATATFRRRFALAMHERSHMLAPRTIGTFRLPPRARRFLDLGGGAGSYSLALAQRYPYLSGMVIDQSVTVARRLIRRNRLTDRIHVIRGNVFTAPLPSQIDAAIASNLFHDFDEAENRRLLRRLHQALRPGGKLFIVEFFLNDAKTQPADAAVFSLLMYAFTATGRCYAWKEIERWLHEEGFGRLRRRPIRGSIGTLDAVRL